MESPVECSEAFLFFSFHLVAVSTGRELYGFRDGASFAGADTCHCRAHGMQLAKLLKVSKSKQWN